MAPSTLVTLSLVMSIGAVADISSAGVLTAPMSRRLVRTESDRQQVAHLLARLTQAARQLHGPSAKFAVAAAPTCAPFALGYVLQLPTVRTGPADEADFRPAPAPPGLAHLIDLPPPADALA